MSRPSRAVLIAAPVVRVLIVANWIYAALLLGVLAYSYSIQEWPIQPFGAAMVGQYPHVGVGIRAIVLALVAGAAIVHSLLATLREILDSVRLGDPFADENARRLEQIAVRVIALELVRFVIAAVASAVWIPGRVGAVSLSAWLAVLLLFVVAGIFREGNRLRADLEGTV